MKKLIALLLCAVMVFSAFPFVASASKFVDVENGKWYSEGIDYCVANGFMAGTSATTFERKTVLSRAMFVTILASLDRAFTEPYADMQMFDDVAPGKWYSGAVNWAAANGLASGIGGGLFGHDIPVSREQMAVFIKTYVDFTIKNYYYIDASKVTSINELPFDVLSRADLSVFNDADEIHDWAEDSMSWAVALGLFSGIGENTLAPLGNCTREQAAVIIHAFQRDVIFGDCRHNIVPARCDEPAYCRFCNLTYGFAEHEYGDNGICVTCGAIFDPELQCGHVWIEENCTDPAWCWRCFAEGDPPVGHDMVLSKDGLYYECQNEFLYSECDYFECAGEHSFIDPTCNDWGYCENCYIDGEDPHHDPDENGICTNCGGEYDPEYDCVHDFVSPECVFLGYCRICGKINSDALGHDYGEDNYCTRCGDILCNDHIVTGEPDCINPSFCDICGDIVENELGHQADEFNHCIRCGLEYDPEYNCFHEWYSDDCLYDVWCWNCGKNIGPMDHDYDDDGYCVICGMSSCTEHNWVEASCFADGYCSNCLEINPDDPAKGHSFSPESHYCANGCGVYYNPYFSKHYNVVENLKIFGADNVDGNLELKQTHEEDGVTFTSSLLKRTGNEEVCSVIRFEFVDDDGNLVSIKSEIAFNEAGEEYAFTVDCDYNGELALSANGKIDPATGDFNSFDPYAEHPDFEDENDARSFCYIVLILNLDFGNQMLYEFANTTIYDYGFAE